MLTENTKIKATLEALFTFVDKSTITIWSKMLFVAKPGLINLDILTNLKTNLLTQQKVCLSLRQVLCHTITLIHIRKSCSCFQLPTLNSILGNAFRSKRPSIALKCSINVQKWELYALTLFKILKYFSCKTIFIVLISWLQANK